jgi:hypothetical protein
MNLAPLQGEPSGLRVRVPLAGMPSMPRVRKSGMLPLPGPWASVETPPSEWQPQPPTFEDDLARQRELARLVATFKPLKLPDETGPNLQRVANGPRVNDLVDVDIGAVWKELDEIYVNAVHQQATLQRMRTNLHDVAYGEVGAGSRRRGAENAASAAAEGGGGGDLPTSGLAVAGSGKGGKSGQPPAAATQAGAKGAMAAAQSFAYTGMVLKLKGALPLTLRPPPGPDAQGPSPVPDDDAQHLPHPSQLSGAAGSKMGAAGSQQSAAARRAQQAAEAKAKAAAREREELGEAAGYTSLRIKPNSSINPRQFWAAVDEYMRPLPKQPPPRQPPPLPLPPRTKLTDRLLAALLPMPPAETAAAATAAAAALAAPPAAAAQPAASRAPTRGPEEAEARLRRSLVTLGLLTGAETAPELQPDSVGAELRAVQAELLPLASENAKTLDEIHRKAAAVSAGQQAERIRLAGLAREQQRQAARLRAQQAVANAPRAPKRKAKTGDTERAANASAANASAMAAASAVAQAAAAHVASGGAGGAPGAGGDAGSGGPQGMVLG